MRSSALVEDRFGSSFAGQFESFIGIETEADFITAVRSCWGALWMTARLRYMATHDIDPADTAMAVLVQPLVSARASGGGLSQTADGGMLLSATWGLGSAIAQGEVTPDRYELSREGELLHIVAGLKDHSVGCIHRAEPTTQIVPKALIAEPCLSNSQAVELGQLLRKVEDSDGHAGGNRMGAGRCRIQAAAGAPAAYGAGASAGQGLAAPSAPQRAPGRHRLGRGTRVRGELRMRTHAGEPGDILITKVAGPALSQILPRVAGVVAERGGSTSHLASLARERGIPMVLGVLDATQRIPDGVRVAVDGVAGVVRWMH